MTDETDNAPLDEDATDNVDLSEDDTAEEFDYFDPDEDTEEVEEPVVIDLVFEIVRARNPLQRPFAVGC